MASEERKISTSFFARKNTKQKKKGSRRINNRTIDKKKTLTIVYIQFDSPTTNHVILNVTILYFKIKVIMNSTNVIFSKGNSLVFNFIFIFCFKVSCLEELPNELFFLIFSYLKSNMVIQTFLDLNQRFQSLILQFTRHLVLSADTESNWINQYMLSIKNDIETITLKVELVASVFSCKYSYPNLRSITMYLGVEWQVELNIENEFPRTAIVSSLNVLGKCSFERVQRDFSKIFESDQMKRTIDSKQVRT
jgi:hypothetical protein